MKKSSGIILLIGIILFVIPLVSALDELPITATNIGHEYIMSKLDVWNTLKWQMTHGYSLFTAEGDARKCDMYPVHQETVSLVGNYWFRAVNYCPSGSALTDIYDISSGSWVFVTEKRDNFQYNWNGHNALEVYCCPHPLCTSNQDCINWGQGSLCKTGSYSGVTYTYCSGQVCTPGWISGPHCNLAKGIDVYRSYQNADCSVEEKLYQSCPSGTTCNMGECQAQCTPHWNCGNCISGKKYCYDGCGNTKEENCATSTPTPTPAPTSPSNFKITWKVTDLFGTEITKAKSGDIVYIIVTIQNNAQGTGSDKVHLEGFIAQKGWTGYSILPLFAVIPPAGSCCSANEFYYGLDVDVPRGGSKTVTLYPKVPTVTSKDACHDLGDALSNKCGEDTWVYVGVTATNNCYGEANHQCYYGCDVRDYRDFTVDTGIECKYNLTGTKDSYTYEEYSKLTPNIIGESTCFETSQCKEREGYNVFCSTEDKLMKLVKDKLKCKSWLELKINEVPDEHCKDFDNGAGMCLAENEFDLMKTKWFGIPALYIIIAVFLLLILILILSKK